MNSDEKLVELYLKGEENLFDVLVKRYADYVFNFIRQYVRDDGRAEDLTQDVFLRVWKNLKKFDTTKKFKVWMFQIARNAVIDFLRKKKELKFSDLEADEESGILDVEDDADGAEEIFEERELQAEVARLLGELPPRYQSVLVLYYQDQLNFREIAEIDGTSENTVRSRHRRALLLLREKFNRATES